MIFAPGTVSSQSGTGGPPPLRSPARLWSPGRGPAVTPSAAGPCLAYPARHEPCRPQQRTLGKEQTPAGTMGRSHTTRSRIAKDHRGWCVLGRRGFQARSQSISGALTFRTRDSVSPYRATCWSLSNHRLTVHRKTTTQEHGAAATAGLVRVTAWRTHRRVDLARRMIFRTLRQCSLNGSQSQRKKVA